MMSNKRTKLRVKYRPFTSDKEVIFSYAESWDGRAVSSDGKKYVLVIIPKPFSK